MYRGLMVSDKNGLRLVELERILWLVKTGTETKPQSTLPVLCVKISENLNCQSGTMKETGSRVDQFGENTRRKKTT